MQLSEKEIVHLVEQVTKEIKKVMIKPEPEQERIYGTVALVADILPSPRRAFEYIKAEYGTDTELYLLNGVMVDDTRLPAQRVDTDEDKAALMQRLALAQRVLLISPSVGTLKRLEEGDDDRFSESCMIRLILWQRDVTIALDFEPPKFKRGTLFEKVTSSIDSLVSMGVKVKAYKPAKNGNEGKLELVTENDIIDARAVGDKTVVCEKDAIVTPLAVDTARELKIYIKRA